MGSEFGDLRWDIPSKPTATGFFVNQSSQWWGSVTRKRKRQQDLNMLEEVVEYKRTRFPGDNTRISNLSQY